MSRSRTLYKDDIKIMVVQFHPGIYDVHMSPAGTYDGAVVFTTGNLKKAVAVSQYLATLSRELLKAMIDDKQNQRKKDDSGDCHGE